MSEHDLVADLLDRIEDETGVRLDPDEHVRVEDGRATLTEAGARRLSDREPRGSGPRFTLPDWMTVGPYTSRAIAFFVGTAVFVFFAIRSLLAGGINLHSSLLWLGALICALLGDYYRTAIHA